MHRRDFLRLMAVGTVIPKKMHIQSLSTRSSNVVKMGLFDLVDPPPGQAGKIISAYRKCNYPWERLIPYLRQDPDQRVIVRWGDTGQGASALYVGGPIEILMSNAPWNMSGDTGFVFTHEVGHLVDAATLTNQDRTDLITMLHTAQPTIGHFDHDHPDAEHFVETWNNFSEPFHARIMEAYADAFVYEFARDVWAGTSGGVGSEEHYIRTIHWPLDSNDIRTITLRRNIQVFSDVPTTHPHYEGIMWAAANNLVAGYSDGTFKPDLKVTDAAGNPRSDVKVSGVISRAAECTILKRYHDAVEAGVI